MRFSVTFSLIALAALASADITLRFWTNANCGGSEEQCGQPGEDFGFCCTAARPFCNTGDCVGCRNGNDLYGFNRAACTGNAINACREPGCCIGLGGGNTCAEIMEIGAGNKNSEMGGEGNSTITPTFVDRDGTKRKCKGVRYPHKMIFTDDKGEKHEIFMPLGTLERAHELFMAENWNQLQEEFPKYTGQVHDYTQLDAEFKAKQEREEREEEERAKARN